MRLRVALGLALLSLGALAAETPNTNILDTLAEGTSPECRARLLEIPELPLLLALLSQTAEPSFRAWSSDLLLKMTLELEQGFESACGAHPPVHKLIASMRAAYFEKLGIPIKKPKDPERLFRGFIAVKDEAAVLSKKLKAAKGRTTDALLKEAYGEVGWIGRSVILGATKEERKTLEELVTSVCPKPSSCLWWDDRAIYKVVVTSQPGVAAYVPELAQLVLSRQLLTQPTRLHQVVLLHELVHSAEKMAWVLSRKKWAEEFGVLSGWEKKDGALVLKVKEVKGVRQDLLTELSLAGSPFSILPDPIVEGFVMAKTYRATLERGDLSEDLADHAAVFRLIPERYCFDGKNLAPLKADWIHKNLFPESKPIACH